MFKLSGRLFEFLNDPTEITYRSYIEGALREIRAINDLLMASARSDIALADTTREDAPWRIQEITDNMQEVVELWHNTQHFNELVKKDRVTLAVKNESETIYYGDGTGICNVMTGYYMVRGKLARKFIGDTEAQAWFDKNNMSGQSPSAANV